MVRKRNQETFVARIDDNDYLFHAWTTDTRNGFCHTVWCYDIERLSSKSAYTKVSYINRTWESFRYAHCLEQAIRKFPKAMQAELKEQLIDRKNREEHERCKQFEQQFKQLYDGLTDRQKEVLAQAPPMQSESDVKFTMGVMGFMNLLNAK